VQGLGRLGEVEVAAHGFLHESELMEIHTEFLLKEKFIMPQPI
jgi:hypothetical protein